MGKLFTVKYHFRTTDFVIFITPSGLLTVEHYITVFYYYCYCCCLASLTTHYTIDSLLFVLCGCRYDFNIFLMRCLSFLIFLIFIKTHLRIFVLSLELYFLMWYRIHKFWFYGFLFCVCFLWCVMIMKQWCLLE